MSTTPSFAATPNRGFALLNSAISTSETAPTNTVTIFTAGSNGSKVEWIRISQVLTTSAGGTVNIFHYDGSTYHLVDFYVYGANTVSSTANVAPIDFIYPYLQMKSGDTLVAVNTVQSGTGTTGATHKLIAYGGDY